MGPKRVDSLAGPDSKFIVLRQFPAGSYRLVGVERRSGKESFDDGGFTALAVDCVERALSGTVPELVIRGRVPVFMYRLPTAVLLPEEEPVRLIANVGTTFGVASRLPALEVELGTRP